MDLKGSLGFTGFADERVIGHLHTSVAARFYITRRLSIEPEFQYLRENSQHYDTVLIPNVAWDFRQGRVIPYVSGGVGYIHSRFEAFPPGFSANELFAQVGAGVKIYLNDRWFVAPDFRAGSELHARITAGIGYTFGR